MMRRRRRRRGLSYQFLLPSITFNGDVSAVSGERKERKEEQEDDGLDRCEKEIRTEVMKGLPISTWTKSTASIQLLNYRTNSQRSGDRVFLHIMIRTFAE